MQKTKTFAILKATTQHNTTRGLRG